MDSGSEDRAIAKVMWWSWSGIAVLAAIVAVVSWFAWEPDPESVPRAREYRDYDICLLTGEAGLTDDEAKAAWTALQGVSLEAKVRLSYVAVTGEQTSAQAQKFVATQVQQKCGIIVAIGEQQVSAIGAVKDKYPAVQFVPAGKQVNSKVLADKVRPMIPAN